MRALRIWIFASNCSTVGEPQYQPFSTLHQDDRRAKNEFLCPRWLICKWVYIKGYGSPSTSRDMAFHPHRQKATVKCSVATKKSTIFKVNYPTPKRSLGEEISKGWSYGTPKSACLKISRNVSGNHMDAINLHAQDYPKQQNLSTLNYGIPVSQKCFRRS